MSDERPTLFRRLLVRVWAQLPEQWRGSAGERFRQTTAAISEYSEQHVRLGERIEEVPDLAWRAVHGAASQRHSEAVLNYAKEENERIRAELERRTLEQRVRKEQAEADKAEAEVRMSRIREIEARIELVDKLRRVRALPMWRPNGSLIIVRAPEGFDWDSLVSDKLIGDDEQRILFSTNAEEVSAAVGSSVSVAEAVGLSDSVSDGAVPEVERPPTPPTSATTIQPPKSTGGVTAAE